MKGTFNHLLHGLVEQPDGRLSLIATSSPEYTNPVENSSYTLACLRWLAATLIKADARLKANDPIVKECQRVFAKLVPYEVDPATGIMVGKGMPLAKSHRHWSHLFMIYPFHEWDWANPKQRPLMEQSLEHWTSKSSLFAGYSWLGAASMYASSGRADRALEFLQSFIKKSTFPNTLYFEGGFNSPVIEPPLAYARTLQEMLMTSDGDWIRIFPAAPSSWAEVRFASMRAEGAFLVSAAREAGVTRFVTIKSLAGEPCRVRPNLPGPVLAAGERSFKVTNLENGIAEIDLAKGETVTLYTGTLPTRREARPVVRKGKLEPWGGSKGATRQVVTSAIP